MSLPDREKLVERASAIYHEIGPQHLTMKVLRKRLEADFGVDLVDHKQELEDIVMSIIRTPQGQKTMAKAEKAVQEGAVNAGKGKAKRSQDKRDDRDDKPAKSARKETKPEKIEGEPKRGLSAFFLFSNEKRSELAPQFTVEGKIDVAAIARKMGELWAQLSEEEKAPYVARANEDKARYEKERAEFEAIHGTAASRKAKAESADVPAHPKKPLNAYFCFGNAKRPEIIASGVKGVPEIGRKVSEMWNALTDKSEWDAAALKDYERYVHECTQMGVTPKYSKPKTSGAEAPADAADVTDS